MGFTKFTLLRPKNVRLLSKSHWAFCVCTVCQNVTYKIQALDAILSKNGKKHLQIHNIAEMMNMLLCKTRLCERFHKVDCVFGKCQKCANFELTIRSHYETFLTDHSDMTIVWQHWERVMDINYGKVKKKPTYKETNGY